MRALRGSLATLGVALLAACGGGGSQTMTPPPAAPMIPPPVTQTVDSSGGTVVGPNGVTLDIPPGALADATQITIAQDGGGAPALPGGSVDASPMYSLLPHGVTFSLPVRLSVPFDPSQTPGGQTPFLAKTNRDGSGWQALVTERDGDTLIAAATGFSILIALRPQSIRIIDQPDDQTAFEGGFAFFRVEAFGSFGAPRVRYQWLHNGLVMPGETNPEILIPRVTLAHDNSLYTARITAGPGLVEESRAARLLVSPRAPRIVNDPVDEQAIVGRTATFFAASASSVAQTLQWQRSNDSAQTFADVSGATSTALTISNVQPADDGALLRMCASNTAGATCSRAARLTVIAQPVQPAVTQQPLSISVASGATAGFTVQATGGSLSYEWRRSADGVTFTPIAGANSATYTISNAQLADDEAFFRARVFNSAGSVLSDAAQLTVLPNPTAAIERLGGGATFSIGLRADGVLRAWGGNAEGQLGDGAFEARSTAVDVVGLNDVATLSVGGYHTLAIRADGEVWSWGLNRDGQLGRGDSNSSATAAPVAGLGPARAVAASLTSRDAFSLAVLADGTVRAWGNNDYGQLGDGTITARSTPVEVSSLSDVVSIAAGDRHVLALRSDGALWAWGANNNGQLGNGDTTASLVPVPIPTPAPIVSIAAGGEYSLALTDEGTVLAWGFNAAGGLGDGTIERRLEPVAVSLPAPAVDIAAAWDGHSLALLADGRVYAWGWNEYGQCGLGTDTVVEATPQPVIAPLPSNIVAIGVGGNHSLALDPNGNVWAWGNNASGQLNDGASGTQRETPVMVGNVNLN